jgi:hypothetical protein
MSARLAPILVSEAKAAQLLDMKPAEFRALVEGGHLPKGREIAPCFVRWDVDELRMIGSGAAVDGGIVW